MRKKIYWVYPHLLFQDGGTKFLLEVCARLAKQYDITVICNVGDQKVVKQFISQKINVLTISFLSANSNLYWLLLPFFLICDTLLLLRHIKKADIVLSTSYPSNFLTFLSCFILRKDYYHYCYEPFPYLQNNGFIRTQPFLKKTLMRITSLLFRWTDAIAVTHAKRVFTLNKITKNFIKDIYNTNSTITLMGVDTRHFSKKIHPEFARKYKGKILITHSTDYSAFKHTDLAIKAIREVARTYPNILLIVTSTNPHTPRKMIYHSLVRSLHLHKNIAFIGQVDYQKLPLYYSYSLCYLSSSFDEMFGTTSSNLPVKEALACETPAIRSAILEEDVIDSKSGFLVDPRDYIEVAKKIMFLIDNISLARAMGKFGRKTILKRYSWDKVANVIQNELIARH